MAATPTETADVSTASGLVYDKGERRHKHVGRGAQPYIQFYERRPREWVGKCPNNLSDDELSTLLNEAIAAPNGDRELPAPKRLYTFAHGAIYEAQTSDGGVSYHGYPYKGKLSLGIIRKLREKATAANSLQAFERWLKDYIEAPVTR